jgi:hypothetical protein
MDYYHSPLSLYLSCVVICFVGGGNYALTMFFDYALTMFFDYALTIFFDHVL